MYDELYKKKYQYERLIKKLEEILIKLENCYSNLILCKKKITNSLKIDNNCYGYKDYEKIINDIDNKKNIIRSVILPEARYQYNKLVLEMSKL